MFDIFSFIPGFGSLVFVLIGLTFIRVHFYFLSNGKKKKAKLIGYEKSLKVMNSSSRSHHREKRIMFTPLYQFSFKGQVYKAFASGSSNVISSDIGSSQSVYIIDNNPNYFRFSKSYELFFGIISLFIGSIAYYFLFLRNFNLLTGAISTVAFCFIYFIILKKSMSKINQTFKGAIHKFIHREHVADEELEKLNIISTNDQVEKILQKNSLAGFIICLVFLSFMSWIAYMVWNNSSISLRDQVMNLLSNPVQNFELIKEEFAKGNKLLIGLSFSGFMGALVTFATIKQAVLLVRR
ncbi:hypothetical protein A9Q84_15350 [Halobacteriovorax marinus]|uniref:Uncharacterized protein n=1 Tax=Halobacteriovorax marinus TaxID=97084 RepID=A0A1Y5FAU6_9BACT|nr:hypothetical protein A9Q84_15350 [Halobacteriovorax marinus]